MHRLQEFAFGQVLPNLTLLRELEGAGHEALAAMVRARLTESLLWLHLGVETGSFPEGASSDVYRAFFEDFFGSLRSKDASARREMRDGIPEWMLGRSWQLKPAKAPKVRLVRSCARVSCSFGAMPPVLKTSSETSKVAKRFRLMISSSSGSEHVRCKAGCSICVALRLQPDSIRSVGESTTASMAMCGLE